MMLNDMLNIYDKHLTKINLNKFALWMCPLSKKKNKIYFCKRKKIERFYQEKLDMYSVKLKKIKIFI